MCVFVCVCCLNGFFWGGGMGGRGVVRSPKKQVPPTHVHIFYSKRHFFFLGEMSIALNSDRLLCCDGQLMMVRAPPANTEARLLHAWGSLAAVMYDSVVGPDELRPYSRVEEFAPLGDALAALCLDCGELKITSKLHTRPDIKCETPGKFEVFIGGEFSPQRFLLPPTSESSVDVVVYQEDDVECFSIKGEGRVPDGLLAPENVNWIMIVRTSTLVVRVARVAQQPEAPPCLRLYRCGILWMQEDVVEGESEGECSTLLIDVACQTRASGPLGWRSLEWIPEFPPGTPSDDVQAFGTFVLREAQRGGRSDVLCRLLQCALPWSATLREQWFREEIEGLAPLQQLTLLQHSQDALLPYIDGSRTLDAYAHREDDDASLRLRSCQLWDRLTRSAGMLPPVVRGSAITPERFEHLFRRGVFGDTNAASRYGYRSACGALVVPRDATHDALTAALALALPDSSPRESIVSAPPPRVIELRPNTQYPDTAARIVRGEKMHAYTLRVRVDTILLLRDHQGRDRMLDETPRCIDALRGKLPPEKSRNRHGQTRHVVRRMFPRLAARMATVTDSERACLQEIQVRRLTSAGWCFADIDECKHLSSRGLSVLLVLLLSAWCGIDATVLLGDGSGNDRAALVGVVVDDGGLLIVDPASSAVSILKIYPQLAAADCSDESIHLRKNAFLEVCKDEKRDVWAVAQVTDMHKDFICVVYYADGRKENLPRNAKWRPLKKHVASCFHSKNKRPRILELTAPGAGLDS